MNVQQIMEDVIQMQNVQIHLEALHVHVILDIQEMVSIVRVFFSFFHYFFFHLSILCFFFPFFFL